MPWAPASVCRAPGCGAKTSHRSGYCEAHLDHRWGNDGKSAHQRGYGRKWRKLRDSVLANEPLCRECFTHGLVALATTVDHIKPKALGGTDDWDNLQPLCKSCHKRKTARDRVGW